MTRYEVDVPVVDALSAAVSGVAAQVRAASGHVLGLACVDVGDAGLASALAGFGQAWAGFTEASAQAVDGTAAAVAAAAASYVHVDESVVADLRVTSAFVAQVAAGGDGLAALAPRARGPR